MAMLFQHRGCSPFARMVRFQYIAFPTRSSSFALCTDAVLQPMPSVSIPGSHVLLGMPVSDLQQLALDFGQKSFRGKQLHHMIYQKRIKDVKDFFQLPQEFRNDLVKEGWRVGRSSVHRTVISADGTIKLLLKLEDNRMIETVGIPLEDSSGHRRLTACISSQVFAIEEAFSNRVTNIVFMGMGEPMLNLKSVLEAYHCFNKDVEIGQRMITISTVGVPNTIRKLASYKLQSTLALSLHAPNQELRKTLVPSANGYPLSAIMDDCRHYFSETRRRVSFEYILLAGVNDSSRHAEELAELLHMTGDGYHVNLISYNPIEGSDFRRPFKKAVLEFAGVLEAKKITVSVRRTRGLDAMAACGQLRNEFQLDPIDNATQEEDEKEVVSI